KKCLAPDAFVRLGTPDHLFPSWKSWEKGAPDLAIEIASENDREADFSKKLEAYHELGVRELVFFDADAPHGTRLRAWDRTDDALGERKVGTDTRRSKTFDLHFIVRPLEANDLALRLAHDPEGRELLPTPVEAKEREMSAEIERLRAELARRPSAGG